MGLLEVEVRFGFKGGHWRDLALNLSRTLVAFGDTSELFGLGTDEDVVGA